jgi:hypothetical protein
MNANLIGNKEIFAIEYSVLTVNPYPLGDCLLWLGGNSLGGLEGEVFLTTVCYYLEGISSIKDQLFLEEYLYNLPEAELFDLMIEQKIDESGKYWFMNTEGFDLFRSCISRRNETLHFLFQLAPEVWKEFELQSLSTQLFSAQVPISIYEESVGEFRNALMKLSNF